MLYISKFKFKLFHVKQNSEKINIRFFQTETKQHGFFLIFPNFMFSVLYIFFWLKML